MSLVEESDLNLDEEVTYEDIVRPQKSAFAKIMSESESLQVNFLFKQKIFLYNRRQMTTKNEPIVLKSNHLLPKFPHYLQLDVK